MNRSAREYAKKYAGKLTARQIAAKRKYPRRLCFTTDHETLCAEVDKALSSL